MIPLNFREADINHIIIDADSRIGSDGIPWAEFNKRRNERVKIDIQNALINALADMMAESTIPIFKMILENEMGASNMTPPSTTFPRKIGVVPMPGHEPGGPINTGALFKNDPTPDLSTPPPFFEPKIELTIHPYSDVKPTIDGIYPVFTGNLIDKQWMYMNYIKGSFSGPGVTHWADPIPNP